MVGTNEMLSSKKTTTFYFKLKTSPKTFMKLSVAEISFEVLLTFMLFSTNLVLNN